MFPEVGSMTVSPGLRIPSFSASSTILTPILSLTEPPALKNSHLATGKREEGREEGRKGGREEGRKEGGREEGREEEREGKKEEEEEWNHGEKVREEGETKRRGEGVGKKEGEERRGEERREKGGRGEERWYMKSTTVMCYVPYIDHTQALRCELSCLIGS